MPGPHGHHQPGHTTGVYVHMLLSYSALYSILRKSTYVILKTCIFVGGADVLG